MEQFPPDPKRAGVVVVRSRAAEDGDRVFALEGEAPGSGDLPDLDAIGHEEALVSRMKERGYRLTMVGGGAGGEELRRFYFRKREA